MTLALFDAEAVANLLPYDGEVKSYGQFLSKTEADFYLAHFLTELAWQHDQVHLFGQHYQTARKVAWYADQAYCYVYSGMPKHALPWPPLLLELKQKIERHLGHPFNSCLANLYANGTQGMGWHRDAEKSLGPQPVIASLSLGATRKFRFKHQRSQSTVDTVLQHGELLLMRGQTQHHWQHSLAKSSRILDARVNLTFRYFYPT